MSGTGRSSSAGIRLTRWLVVLSCVAAGALGALVPRDAASQDRNFAGSLQTNYLYVPTDPDVYEHAFDGLTNELSLKVAVDFNDNVSANVKLCYGCHGIELGMAFVDLRVVDELNFRIGRFIPAFGDFPLRHDPANHRTSDKPLPYDMGRMLRMREYNLSVLPAPYVDQGIEIDGTHWFGTKVQLDYAIHAVGGLRSAQGDLDVDFVRSRSVYYVDNNSEPSIGARIAWTFDITENLLTTVGASALAGRSDPERSHEYAVFGADFYLRVWELDLHAEYLLRRTEYEVGAEPETRFRYGPDDDGDYADFFLKDGFYVDANLPVSTRLELVARFDGLRRIGNVSLNSPLGKRSALLRYTAGFNVILDGSVRLKFSGEFYDFADFDDEIAVNAGAVAAF